MIKTPLLSVVLDHQKKSNFVLAARQEYLNLATEAPAKIQSPHAPNHAVKSSHAATPVEAHVI
jgi:hypothetical protein